MPQINNTQTRKLGVTRRRDGQILKIEKIDMNVKTKIVHRSSLQKNNNEENYSISSFSIDEQDKERKINVNNQHYEEL